MQRVDEHFFADIERVAEARIGTSTENNKKQIRSLAVYVNKKERSPKLIMYLTHDTSQYDTFLDTTVLDEASSVQLRTDASVLSNEPYSSLFLVAVKKHAEWIKKAHDQAKANKTRIAVLCPARTDSDCFAKYCINTEGSSVFFVTGRVIFEGKVDREREGFCVVKFDFRETEAAAAAAAANDAREVPSCVVTCPECMCEFDSAAKDSNGAAVVLKQTREVFAVRSFTDA